MRILIDGIFYRISDTGIARVWTSIVPLLVEREGLEVHVLDRGGVPRMPGVTPIAYPTSSSTGDSVYNYCADDSILIERMCRHFEIDVFMSTFFTSPLSTPTLQVVYDMIPELFEFGAQRGVMSEREVSFAYSQRFVCISESTRRDLLSFYPEIPAGKVDVAHCGVDKATFRPRAGDDVGAWRKANGLARDLFLFVGSRVQHQGYKNSRLFFDAIAGMRDADFDILCVGGEGRIEDEILRSLPPGVGCRRVDLTDGDLCLAYNAATALVYPSLYEGFGMPVVEAMASGCPVITTRHGALVESAGEAACLVSGTSVEEMRQALDRVRAPEYRESLRRKGLEQASRFSWEAMAAKVAAAARLLHEEAGNGDYDAFFKAWSGLRALQASVDFEWTPLP